MTKVKFRNQLYLHLMMLPAVILLIIFHYIPMAGVLIAFEKYYPRTGIFGSEWIWFDNFKYMMNMPEIYSVIRNTLFIAVMKIVAGLVFSLGFSLLLNEIGSKITKKSVQTLVFLPHFLSWVIVGGIVIDTFSPSTGIINDIIKSLGFDPIFFLGDAKWFPYTMVITDVWKGFGFGAIIYLAALTGIDHSLYESAMIDGAGRLKQTIHVTLPGIMPIVVLMSVLSIGNVLNAGFEQIFLLYNPAVYSSGDIIDTLVYRVGLVDFQYGVSTAVGLFKSLVSIILITISYKLADKYAGYSVF
ncbi:ABC transporter permease [Clostridium lacusfryxellense]|uniref:ABC transporter permease n=1 Tax=Clostridium lacusfryxellense TaxID=205328 RepID=UPI001C0C74C1|nr:ABC transporter permease subunit [Clostridium lacusfryxellense]MBU3113335.1 ABC transporter permease subunit [Clostridium lacusfryxellense]